MADDPHIDRLARAMAPNGIVGSPLRVVDHGYLGFGVGRSIEIRRVADDALAASLDGMAAVRSDSMAYANLFAAAPELYEAAAALLDAALDALTDVQLPASVAERFRAAERKTRAALAKAHGEG